MIYVTCQVLSGAASCRTQFCFDLSGGVGIMAEKIRTKEERSYIKLIDEMIRSLRFGNVNVIVQDGKVIQIEKTEKYRIKN